MDKTLMSEAELSHRSIQQLYKRVFGTPEGKKVLFSILSDLKFMSETVSDADTALRNYAIFLIRERIGFNDAQGLVSLIETMISRKE